jgi:hypothetical protein
LHYESSYILIPQANVIINRATSCQGKKKDRRKCNATLIFEAVDRIVFFLMYYKNKETEEKKRRKMMMMIGERHLSCKLNEEYSITCLMFFITHSMFIDLF